MLVYPCTFQLCLYSVFEHLKYIHTLTHTHKHKQKRGFPSPHKNFAMYEQLHAPMFCNTPWSTQGTHCSALYLQINKACCGFAMNDL